MMKRIGAGWLLAIGMFIWTGNDGPAQKKSKSDVNEIVEVVNVEMIARVQKQGQPVGGLRKEDFILTENGREVEINGFREVRRRISAPPASEEKAVAAVRPSPGRLFVLAFSLRERNAAFTEVLDRFFREIYRPGDIVILAHSKNTVMISVADEISPMRARFEAEMRKEIEADNNTRNQLFRDIDQAVNEYLTRDPKEDESFCRFKLQNSINETWKEFRVRFLEGDSGGLLRLADSMKPIHQEKWVLIFLQEETFPQFNEDGEIPAFRNRLEEMRKNLGDGFSAFTEKVRTAFIAANATVSLIRLKSGTMENQGGSAYYQQRVVYSDRDDCFQQISRVTGGATVTDNNLTRALDQVAQKEDISYVITFAPEDIKKKRKVELACRDADLKVVASRHIDTGDPREMSIAKVELVDSRLTFNLSGFSRLFEADRLQGRVLVQVVAKDSGPLNVESSREFTPTDPVVQIPVLLRLPVGRRYTFNIRVLDHISGRQVSRQVTLRNSKPDHRPTMPVKHGGAA